MTENWHLIFSSALPETLYLSFLEQPETGTYHRRMKSVLNHKIFLNTFKGQILTSVNMRYRITKTKVKTQIQGKDIFPGIWVSVLSRSPFK